MLDDQPDRSTDAIEAVLQDERARIILSRLVREFKDRRRVVDNIARYTPVYQEVHAKLARIYAKAVGEAQTRRGFDRHFICIFFDPEHKKPCLSVRSYPKRKAKPMLSGMSAELCMAFDLAALSQVPFTALKRMPNSEFTDAPHE